MIEYPQIKYLEPKYIKKIISSLLIEDSPKGDITTNLIVPKKKIIKSEMIACENLVFVGENIIPYFFEENCNINILSVDGDIINNGDTFVTIKGSANEILLKERVMLNLIQRLCGIATLTKKFSEIAKPFNIKILDTRKTTPGLRLFEKYAVKIGGGYNHRLNLSEGILIKDNHIAVAGSVTNAITFIKKNKPLFLIQLEVDSLDQITEALEIGVDGFLLDNMSPQLINQAIKIIKQYKEDIFIEVSGGINLNNIQSYANNGIDAISIGALTHSAKSSDISLKFHY
tara:strand:- start:9261 stop:10118 length:858 start_codon:yes stop_codon:yes gene_type:complete